MTPASDGPGTASRSVLIVEDDPAFRRLLTHELEPLDLVLHEAATLEEARRALDARAHELLLLDLGLPDGDGRELLPEARDRGIPAVVLTAADAPGLAETCLEGGALDFVPKPLEPVRLLTSVRGALRQAELERTVSDIASANERPRGLERLVGASPAMARVADLLRRAAGTQITVLITGASGTGKEVAARALHEESDRADEPFVALNCGAIPEALIESELFGHEKGAFTGAHSERPGCFEAASGGTLFLDEIGEMPMQLQVKLLRVLQERVIERVGDLTPRKVDIRLVAATNKELQTLIREGSFREDLFYRLNELTVQLPPLRERGEDIAVLGQYFLNKYREQYSGKANGFTNQALLAMNHYAWPGNVRELENRVKKAVIMSDRALLNPDDLGLEGTDKRHVLDLDEAAERYKMDYVRQVLELNNWNKAQTARDLGVDPRTIFRYIEKMEDVPEGSE